ncbi:MAG: hypothetical protein LAP21_21790 [Acidobacteriia bacterium]|nr:hypothetical protein [Terriglobia bacterium]
MKSSNGMYFGMFVPILAASLIFCSGCRSKETTTADVNASMLKYAREKRYDRAISLGEQWAQKEPNDYIIRIQLASVYLSKASVDVAHRKELVRRAERYANEAVKVEPTGLATLQLAAAVLEGAGDLSDGVPAERCDDYRSALQVTEKEKALLQDDSVADQHRTSIITARESTAARVRGKMQSSGCE